MWQCAFLIVRSTMAEHLANNTSIQASWRKRTNLWFKTSLPFTMSNILFLFLFFACRVMCQLSIHNVCCIWMHCIFSTCLCLERPKQPNSLPYTLILLVYLYIDLFKAVILCCTWGHFITADIRWHFNYISLSRQIVKIEP